MKNCILTIILALCTMFGVNAATQYSRNVKDLPSAAQTFVKKNFKAKVNLIKMDKKIGGVSEYEVILTDGTEINMDRLGQWTEIEVGADSKVPDSVVPKNILDYVKKNIKTKKIIGILKKRNGYEVELDNGMEIEFDTQGKFVKMEK